MSEIRYAEYDTCQIYLPKFNIYLGLTIPVCSEKYVYVFPIHNGIDEMFSPNIELANIPVKIVQWYDTGQIKLLVEINRKTYIINVLFYVNLSISEVVVSKENSEQYELRFRFVTLRSSLNDNTQILYIGTVVGYSSQYVIVKAIKFGFPNAINIKSNAPDEMHLCVCILRHSQIYSNASHNDTATAVMSVSFEACSVAPESIRVVWLSYAN